MQHVHHRPIVNAPPDSSPEHVPAFSVSTAEAADRHAIEELQQACGNPPDAGRDGAPFWLVRQDGVLVGCAACTTDGDAALLSGIAVSPAARGCGIGSSLVTTILRQMVAKGVRSIGCLQGDSGLLRRFGFLPVRAEALAPALRSEGHLGSSAPESASAMLLDLRGGTLVRPAARTDMPAALAIYNDAVADSTATYDYEPRAPEEQYALYDQKMADGLGFFVACTLDGTVAGFSTYGLYRTRPGWRFASEHSVYVAAPWRGMGVGLGLLPPIMWHARRKGFHTMIGVVDAANQASLRMHRRAGFTDVGTVREGGYKFDRWLDVAFLQAML